MAYLLIPRGRNSENHERIRRNAAGRSLHHSDPVMIEKLLKSRRRSERQVVGKGETALMTAARTGSVESVKALLDHGSRR